MVPVQPQHDALHGSTENQILRFPIIAALNSSQRNSIPLGCAKSVASDAQDLLLARNQPNYNPIGVPQRLSAPCFVFVLVKTSV